MKNTAVSDANISGKVCVGVWVGYNKSQPVPRRTTEQVRVPSGSYEASTCQDKESIVVLRVAIEQVLWEAVETDPKGWGRSWCCLRPPHDPAW